MDRDIPPECGVSDYDAARHLTCLGLLRDLKRDKDKQSQLIHAAEIRERWVLGEDWAPRDPLMETIHTETAMPGGVLEENLLYPLTLTYTARVNEGKIDPVALPSHATAANVAQADATNAAIDFLRRDNDEDEICTDGTQLAQYHGDVLFLPRWDPGAGPRLVNEPVMVKAQTGPPGQDGAPTMVDTDVPDVDPATGQPRTQMKWEWGEVVEEVVAAPDYWTDLVGEDKKATYRAVRWVVPLPEARAAMLSGGFSGDSLGGDHHYDNPADLAVTGVECHELWCKPGTRFANGLHAVYVGDVVTHVSKWDLPFSDLPGAVFKIGKIRGCPRGKTHVANAVHQQRLLNKSLRALEARLVEAGSSILTGPDEQVRQMPRGGFKRIPTQLPRSRDVRWVSGDEVPASLFTAYQNARRALYDVFGVNEATSTGGDPTATKSGKQMEIAQNLDAQKFTPAREALQRAREQVAIQKVELARANWTQARMISVIGPQGTYESRWLAGADIGGQDVIIETASGLLNSRLAAQRTAEERGQAGLISPQDAAEESRTGLDQTVGSAEEESRVDAQALQALQGKPVQPLPDVNPGAAARRLLEVARSPLGQGSPQGGQAIAQLAQRYQQMAQQAAQAAEQQQGGQPPGGQGKAPGTGRVPSQGLPARALGGGVKATSITAERAASQGNGSPSNGAKQ